MTGELKITKDELIYNFNKWTKTKGNNVLFITGLSGSGKSTKAKEFEKKYGAVHLELDAYEHARKHFCKYVDEFMDLHPKYKKLAESDWKNTHGEDLIDEFYEGAILYFQWLIKKIRKDHTQLFVIEGIQLYSWGEEIEAEIKGQPLIIKLTTPQECEKRILARDVNNTDFGRHELPKLMRHYNYLKYFIKRMDINYDLKAYDPPLNKEEIIKYYPNNSFILLNDPVHKWRAETGIELIHEEPSLEEQKRIWENWQLMTPDMKKISDKKCKELFGMTNKELHCKIMKEKWGLDMKKLNESLQNIEVFITNPKLLINRTNEILLYHGTNILYDILKPMTVNLGTRLSKTRKSIFLTESRTHSIIAALVSVLYDILDNNNDIIDETLDRRKLWLSFMQHEKLYLNNILNLPEINKQFSENNIYIYSAKFPINKLAKGHVPNEYTIDEEVDYADIEELSFNDFKKYIEFTSAEQLQKLDADRDKIANKSKTIIDHMLYLNKEERQKRKEKYKKLNETFKVGDKIIHPQYDIEVTIVELDSNIYQCKDEEGNSYAIEMDSICESFNDDYLGYVRYTKKEREDMDPNDFAIPELKKFPITDPGNVNDAKVYFRYVPPKYQKSAANRIFDKMVELDMPLQGEGEWTKYISKDRLVILQHKPRLTAEDIEKDAKGKWIIKKTYDIKTKYPLFVILTANPSPMGKAIRGLTGSEFNHASISFDPTLDEMYSFSFQSAFTSGFVQETISTYMNIDTDETPSKYAVYCTFISEVKLGLMRDMLTDFKEHVQDYSYNFKGLVNFLSFKIPKKNDKTMFCSEFVANILQGIDESLGLSKSANLTAPEDLKDLPKFKLIETGRSGKFDVEEFQKKVNKFIKSKEAINFFTENADIFNLAIFDKLEPTKDITQDSIFKLFAPCMIEPWRGVTAKSFGGVYDDLLRCTTDDEMRNVLDTFYQSGANKYFVEANNNDLNMIKYRLKLHANITDVFAFNSSSGKRREEIIDVVKDWVSEVEKVYKLMPNCPQRNQALYELFWNPEIEFTEENRKRNLLMIDLYYELFMGSLNEDSFFNRSDEFSTFSANLPDEIYLLPSARKYPILNAYMLCKSAELFNEEEGYDPVEFIESFKRLYAEYNCKFNITHDLPLYKHVKDILPTEIEVEGTTTKDTRDLFLGMIFSETSVSKSQYNFEIDKDGSIMISEKEKADFEEHYRDSLRLLKIYKREKNIESIKKELCRIFYMVKMIEAILMTDSLEASERKTYTTLRAKMLSSFSQYLSVVIDEEKDFDFNDYFQKSPYGDALVINIKSIEGTFKILGLLKTILGM